MIRLLVVGTALLYGLALIEHVGPVNGRVLAPLASAAESVASISLFEPGARLHTPRKQECQDGVTGRP